MQSFSAHRAWPIVISMLILSPPTIVGAEVPNELPSKLDALVARESIHAASAAWVEDGAIGWSRALGTLGPDSADPVDEDTPFPVTTLTPLLTSLAILQLAEEGRIDLEAPVSRYCSGVRPTRGSLEEVTVRQVLTEQAGIRGKGIWLFTDEPRTSTEVLNTSGRDTGLTVTGRRDSHHVGDLEYVLLQHVIEQVTKQDFADYMESNVLRPLGMNHSTFRAPEPGSAVQGFFRNVPGMKDPRPTALGAVGLYSTATDLARFAIACLPGEAEGPLNRPTIRSLYHAGSPNPIFQTLRPCFGRSPRTSGNPCLLYLDPESRCAVVVLTCGRESDIGHDWDDLIAKRCHAALMHRAAVIAPADDPRHVKGYGEFDESGSRVRIGSTLYEVGTWTPIAEVNGLLSHDGKRVLTHGGGHVLIKTIAGDEKTIAQPKIGRRLLPATWDQEEDTLFFVTEVRDEAQAKKNRRAGRSKKKSKKPLPPEYEWTIERRDSESEKPASKDELPRRPLAVSVSPDGKVLVLTERGPGILYGNLRLRSPKEHPLLDGVKEILGWDGPHRALVTNGGKRLVYDVKKKELDSEPGFSRGMLERREQGPIVSGRTESGVAYYRRGSPEEVMSLSLSQRFPRTVFAEVCDVRYSEARGEYLVLCDGGLIVAFDPVADRAEIIHRQATHSHEIVQIARVGAWIISTDQRGRVIARDESSGELAWRYETMRRERNVVTTRGQLWSRTTPSTSGGRRSRSAEIPKLTVLDVATGKTLAELESSTGAMEFGASSADGGVVAVGGKSGFEVYDGEKFERLFAESPGALVNLAVAPDGKRVFAFFADRFRVYDVPSGELAKTVEGEFGDRSVHIDADGRAMVTTSLNRRFFKGLSVYNEKRRIVEWDLNDYTMNWSLEVKNGGDFWVTPDEKRLLVTGAVDRGPMRNHGVMVIDRSDREYVWDPYQGVDSHSTSGGWTWSRDGRTGFFTRRESKQLSRMQIPDHVRFD